MVSFLSRGLESLYKNLMHLILKPDASDNLSGFDLLHVNLINKSIYFIRKDTHLGFEIRQIYQVCCFNVNHK